MSKAGRVARGISSKQRRALTTAGDVLYFRAATTAPADRPVDEVTAALRACLEASLLQWLTHACGDLRSLERCSLASTSYSGCGMTGSAMRDDGLRNAG